MIFYLDLNRLRVKNFKKTKFQMSPSSSKVFSAYRALGVNSDHVPCVIRYNQKHQETYVITSVGRAFHVYKVKLLCNS